jgi:hypothetical protein
VAQGVGGGRPAPPRREEHVAHLDPLPGYDNLPARSTRRFADAESYPDFVIELRLTHPAIDFWVEVRLRRVGSGWLAVADLASSPEPAMATRADLAVLLALWPLGSALARRLTARADLPA